MNGNKHSIYVEGETDKSFLKVYLARLGLNGWEINQVQGKDGLSKRKPTFEQIKNRGGKNIVVFDADENPLDRRKEIEETIRGFGLQLEEVPIFLFPDNKGKGRLEDLLRRLVPQEYKFIFCCFDQYEACVKEGLGKKILQYKPEDLKARMYAYWSALTDDRKKKENAPIGPGNFWNFKHEAINPLREFLSQYFDRSGAIDAPSL